MNFTKMFLWAVAIGAGIGLIVRQVNKSDTPDMMKGQAAFEVVMGKWASTVAFTKMDTSKHKGPDNSQECAMHFSGKIQLSPFFEQYMRECGAYSNFGWGAGYGTVEEPEETMPPAKAAVLVAMRIMNKTPEEIRTVAPGAVVDVEGALLFRKPKCQGPGVCPWVFYYAGGKKTWEEEKAKASWF